MGKLLTLSTLTVLTVMLPFSDKPGLVFAALVTLTFAALVHHLSKRPVKA